MLSWSGSDPWWPSEGTGIEYLKDYLPELRECAELSYPRYRRQLDIGKAYELYP